MLSCVGSAPCTEYLVYVPLSPTRTSTCLSLVIPESIRGSPTNVARVGSVPSGAGGYVGVLGYLPPLYSTPYPVHYVL